MAGVAGSNPAKPTIFSFSQFFAYFDITKGFYSAFFVSSLVLDHLEAIGIRPWQFFEERTEALKNYEPIVKEYVNFVKCGAKPTIELLNLLETVVESDLHVVHFATGSCSEVVRILSGTPILYASKLNQILFGISYEIPEMSERFRDYLNSVGTALGFTFDFKRYDSEEGVAKNKASNLGVGIYGIIKVKEGIEIYVEDSLRYHIVTFNFENESFFKNNKQKFLELAEIPGFRAYGNNSQKRGLEDLQKEEGLCSLTFHVDGVREFVEGLLLLL